MEVKNSTFFKLTASALLLGAADIVASLLVWKGAPTDWSGEPPHFWTYELWRLKYWSAFFVLSALLWIIVWKLLGRRIHKPAIWLFAVSLAVAVEISTSIWYWRQLPSTQASYLGWSYFPSYFRAHAIAWSSCLLLCLAFFYLWVRSRRRLISTASLD